MDLTKKKTLITLVVVLAIAIILPFALNQPYYIHVATMCLLWAYFASSWNILGGFAGQLSLGHAMYAAAGAYITVILLNTFGISPWIGMFVGGAGAILLAVLVGYPTFHLRGAYYALSTVAISAAIEVLIINTKHIGPFLIGGAEGLSVKMMGEAPLFFQFMSKIPYYYIALVLLIIIILVSKYIKSSRLGYQLAALKDDEDAAKALGINVRVAKLKAAALSAFFTAIGGVFYAMMIRYLEPSAIAGSEMSTQMVFLTIVGGSGTVLGPVIGGLSLSLLSEVIQFYLSSKLMGLHLFVYGAIVVAMIIYKPQGIIEIIERGYKKLLRIPIAKGDEIDDDTTGA